MVRPALWCVSFSAALLATGVVQSQRPFAPGSRTARHNPASPEEIQTYLHRCAAYGWSGSALVARDGIIVVKRGYGLADRERRVPNSEQTLFEIASATKQFTAAAVLRLEQQGRLSTDDAIAKHLPGVPEDCGGITIYHLLTHTSGMPRSATGGGGEDLEKAVRGYFGSKPVRKPGEKAEYWNGGYALLAGIVEVASGKSYMDYCREQLFEPAGMKGTGFTGDTHLHDAFMAVGYSGKEPVRKAVGHPYGTYGWQYRGMGGVVTSVVDLFRWDRALRGDAVLGKAARDKLFKPFKSKVACGWYVFETERETRKIMHGGDVKGFHAHIARFPEDDAVIIVTSNSDDVPLYAVAGALEGLAFGGTRGYPMPPRTMTLSDEKLRSVEGTYQLAAGEKVVVQAVDGGITVGGEGQTAVDLLLPFPRPRDPKRFDKQTERVLEMTRRVAKGDVGMLSGMLLEGIPASWPETVKSSTWPAHVEKWGALETVRSLGAVLIGRDRLQLVLALEHEKGSARCRVVLQGDKLNIFDLSGPEFPMTVRCLPAATNVFVRFAWVGPQPEPVHFERSQKGDVTAVSLATQFGPARRFEKVR